MVRYPNCEGKVIMTTKNKTYQVSQSIWTCKDEFKHIPLPLFLSKIRAGFPSPAWGIPANARGYPKPPHEALRRSPQRPVHSGAAVPGLLSRPDVRRGPQLPGRSGALPTPDRSDDPAGRPRSLPRRRGASTREIALARRHAPAATAQ